MSYTYWTTSQSSDRAVEREEARVLVRGEGERHLALSCRDAGPNAEWEAEAAVDRQTAMITGIAMKRRERESLSDEAEEEAAASMHSNQ